MQVWLATQGRHRGCLICAKSAALLDPTSIVQAMGSIFAGLVQVGAWGCFDEFNRINIEVLSVVSAQLKAIQNSLVSGKPTVDIGVGGEIKIKRVAGFATCGVFITMNPGYAGRTELPDNLKALFRPVTMIVPDLLQICEIMLFSEGFEAAKARCSFGLRIRHEAEYDYIICLFCQKRAWRTWPFDFPFQRWTSNTAAEIYSQNNSLLASR